MTTDTNLKNEFPKLDGGWCDGGGCGNSNLCYCGQWLKSREQYQTEYNSPWNNESIACKIWEKSFRHAFDTNNEIYKQNRENFLREDKYTSRLIGDNNETISILCDLIEDYEDRIDRLEEALNSQITDTAFAEVKLEEALNNDRT